MAAAGGATVKIHFRLVKVDQSLPKHPMVTEDILFNGEVVGIFHCRLDVAHLLGAILRGEATEKLTITMDAVPD